MNEKISKQTDEVRFLRARKKECACVCAVIVKELHKLDKCSMLRGGVDCDKTRIMPI